MDDARRVHNLNEIEDTTSGRNFYIKVISDADAGYYIKSIPKSQWESTTLHTLGFRGGEHPLLILIRKDSEHLAGACLCSTLKFLLDYMGSIIHCLINLLSSGLSKLCHFLCSSYRLDQCIKEVNDMSDGQEILMKGVDYERNGDFACAKYCYKKAGDKKIPLALSNLAHLIALSGDWKYEDWSISSCFEASTEWRWQQVKESFSLTLDLIELKPLGNDLLLLDDNVYNRISLIELTKKCRALKLHKVNEDKEDYKKFHALCGLALLLQEPRNPKYNPPASLFLLKYGFDHGDAESAFWLGRSLTLGIGCPVRARYGRKLVEAAASKQVPRAYFEMGIMFEFGYKESEQNDCKPNFAIAKGFYYAATLSAGKDPHSQRYLDEFELAVLWRNTEWHELQDYVLNAVSQTMTWEVAGQAFLFNAASVLTTVQHSPNNYPILLDIIPSIGILFALFSCWSSFTVILLNKKRRWKVLHDVYRAKLDACKQMVGARRAVTAFGPPHDRVSGMACILDWLAFSLSVAFLIAWAVILKNK
jgi:hypothetical protein